MGITTCLENTKWYILFVIKLLEVILCIVCLALGYTIHKQIKEDPKEYEDYSAIEITLYTITIAVFVVIFFQLWAMLCILCNRRISNYVESIKQEYSFDPKELTIVPVCSDPNWEFLVLLFALTLGMFIVYLGFSIKVFLFKSIKLTLLLILLIFMLIITFMFFVELMILLWFLYIIRCGKKRGAKRKTAYITEPMSSPLFNAVVASSIDAGSDPKTIQITVPQKLPEDAKAPVASYTCPCPLPITTSPSLPPQSVPEIRTTPPSSPLPRQKEMTLYGFRQEAYIAEQLPENMAIEFEDIDKIDGKIAHLVLVNPCECFVNPNSEKNDE